jgi:hypothetical protein
LEETSDPIRAGRYAVNALMVMVAGLIAVAVANEEVIAHPHGYASFEEIQKMDILRIERRTSRNLELLILARAIVHRPARKFSTNLPIIEKASDSLS